MITNNFHKNTRKKNNNLGNIRKKLIFNLKKYKKSIYVLISLIIVIVPAFVIVNTLILSEKNKITEISFDERNISEFDDPYLYKDIKDKIVGNNFFAIKYIRLNSIKEEFILKYKIIRNIKIKKLENGKTLVTFDFKKPNLIFSYEERIIGVTDGFFFDISSGSLFLSGEKQNILLPKESIDIGYFSGFFFKVDEKRLKFQIEEIKNFFGKNNIDNIMYIPGGTKTIITLYEGKKIYINNLKNIGDQLKKYIALSTNYGNFKDTKEIDLGSSDDVIIK